MSTWESVPLDINDNTRKFLDFLSKAEGADYNTITGGGKFDDFSRHPGVVGMVTKQGPSTAAGRYQITKTTYNDIAPKLGINDFSPESQDRIALELIKRNGALQYVQDGDYGNAIKRLGGTWASLPSSPYVGHAHRSQGWVEKTLNAMIPSANATSMSNKGQWESAPKTEGGWEPVPTVADAKSNGGWEDPTPVVQAKLPDIEIPAQRKLTNESVVSDPQWISNAKTLYQETQGKPFQGDDKAAADWLKNYMGQFNWNLVQTGKTALDARNFSDSGKKALLQSMQDYDALPASMEGAGRFLKGVATDPTTYLGLGLGSLFTKTAGREALKEGAKLAIKEGVENATKKSLASKALSKVVPSAVTTEAATYGAANNLANQAAKINAGGQENLDVADLAKDTALSAVGGKVLNTVVDKVTGRSALRNFAGKSGSEEGARVDSEIISDLQNIAGNANLRGNKVQAVQMNALEQKYVADVNNAMKSLGKENLAKMGVNQADIQAALQAKKIITPEELSAIRGNPAGDALADAIEKAQRARALTAANPADNNMLVKGIRIGADYSLPGIISKPLNYLLNNRKSREEVTSNLIKKDSDTASRVLDLLGPSQASQSLENIQNLATKAQAAAQARAQQQAAAKAQALAQQAQNKNAVLNASRMPLGGSFQELLQGGRSGLNMSSDQAIDALRLVSQLDKADPQNKVIADAARQILQSGGDIKDPNVFYGVQNTIRRLSEEGKIGSGALSQASSGIRNPTSYAANVRNAEEALKLARDAAPSKELAQFSSSVGRIKSSADKAKAIEDRLAKATDQAEVDYLNTLVKPLANFGKK